MLYLGSHFHSKKRVDFLILMDGYCLREGHLTHQHELNNPKK